MARILPFSLALLLVVNASAAPLPKTPDADKLSREIMLEFTKALEARDTAAIRKTMTVPFYLGAKEEIYDEKQLDGLIAILAKSHTAREDQAEIIGVYTAEDIVKWHLKNRERELPKNAVELLAECVGPDGRFVRTKGKNKDDVRSNTNCAMIRIDKGVAKIVGILE